MRILLAALTTSFLLCSLQASAAPNPQQQKMTTCNAQAKDQHLSGDTRQSFMKTCLSSGGSTEHMNSQQEKMKSCNADAKTQHLQGAERKTFMSSCLKK